MTPEEQLINDICVLEERKQHVQTMEDIRKLIKRQHNALDSYASTKAEEVAKRAFIAGGNYSCDVPTKCMVTTSDELEAFDEWYTQDKLSQI